MTLSSSHDLTANPLMYYSKYWETIPSLLVNAAKYVHIFFTQKLLD